MEFEGKYLTYEEYKGLGGTLDLMPFNILEFESRRKIDEKTMNRLKNAEKIPQEVKFCEYKLINSIESYVDDKRNKNISSESTDGYSISYISPSQISDVINSKNNELDDIIITSLFGVIVNNEHLIYRGI